MSTDPSSPESDANLSGLGRLLLGTNEGSKPSGPWVPPTAEELHAILPQYEIVKMLGRGGMGAVYMGRQTALDRPVAIKILSGALEESDQGFTERFKNEARAMGKLNHPAIVSVYEFGQHDSGLLYIVMEYVDGTDVAKMIAAKGRLHTEHAMAITAHVCDALAYAHERGIIHRDIKPANIMVGYDGEVKVADFGLAKVDVGGHTLGLTQSGMAMGTLHFMAPEALMLGTSVDHRADIYAVGVMLFQMLTGKLPQGMFKMPSLQVPGLDPRYDGIIAKAMMEDREARYQSAREMRSDLDGILTQPVVRADPEAAKAQQPVLPPQARPQRPGGKPVMRPAAAPSVPQPQRGSLTWLWMTVLVVAALCGAALLLLPKGKQEQPGIEAASATAEPPSASQPALVSATTTNPAEATKERPLVNSLGMKFVPVPGTNVLFSIHETRYKDYAAFSKETTGVNGAWKDQSSDGFAPQNSPEDHPVWKVSWDDAKEFCKWLSQKESKTYRLPSDREWSMAVGIGDKESPNLTPADLAKRLPDIWPWGNVFPPPISAGNFGDRSRATHAPKEGANYMLNYDDGYPTTAPVMSFPPNTFGLHDMAGSLYEWCEDKFDPQGEDRVLRGASWMVDHASYLRSAYRNHAPTTSRNSHNGFRVAMVVDSQIATVQATTDAAVRMILSKGGSATILIGKDERVVTRVEELPKDSYEAVELRLIAPSSKTPILTSADMQTLAGLQALERLKLSDVSFPEGDLSVLRTLPRLAVLELRGNKGLTAESFSPLAGMTSLTHLSTINMPEVDDTFLPVILSLSQLESLSFHQSKGVSTGFIESLAALPKLNRLTVSGFHFGKATDLGKLRALTKLELYDFRGAALDSALSGLAAGNKIDLLAFHGGEISDSQMQMLARWPALRSLLLENVKLPASRLVSFSGSRIQALDTVTNDRQFDDEALLSASRMAALKNLSLSSKSPATEAGIAAFRKARPDVKIARRQESDQASEDVAVASSTTPPAKGSSAVMPVAVSQPVVPPQANLPMPMPRTDPPTWIDTKGRSIQAKFVRVEGTNVLLDIAGKVAPVAMSTLSNASQKQARDLQAQLPAEPAVVSVSQAPSVSPPPAASPPPLPNTTVITPGWRPMFPDEAALRATPGVTQLTDGWWRFDHVFFEAPAKARNLRLRVHARFQVGAAPSLIARWDSLNPGRGPSGDYYGYQATFYDTGGGKDDPWVNGIASVSRRNGGVPEPGGYRARNSPRFKKDLNLRPGDEYDMEFELVGENFKLGIDGQEGTLAGFASCPGSGFGLFSRGAVEVSRMEWQELDEKGKVIPAAPPEVLDWTDTQGKALRGQFKGMDMKGNVLLDLSGRITPVPWSLLSPASQRQVRAMHAPSTLSPRP